MAGAVGDRLAALARRDSGGVSWVGLTSRLGEQDWSVLPLGPDLYGGLSGVALFLAHLGAISGEERHIELARATVASLRQQAEEARDSLALVGGFLGWGSLIYTYAHLGALWNDPSLYADAEAIVSRLPALIEQDAYLDVVLGSAGCIGGLISLYHCRPSRAVLAAAIQCGDHLLERATRTERGLGWLTPASGAQPLAGFSHGAAGYAWALFELAALTGQDRFREAALAAIEEERGLFVPEAGNWRDLRHGETGGTGTFAWCHGAPGVGLGRLLCLPHLDDERVREEIAAALESTLARGFGANHCLCHGDLGNLETLLQAALRLQEPKVAEAANRLAGRIVHSIDRNGCLCGVPLAVEVPGLMVGIAGIGYQLLRLAEPSRVPSVLGLARPTGAREKQ
jgi:type 2 lantibiotic biosynthesis protein LanM